MSFDSSFHENIDSSFLSHHMMSGIRKPRHVAAVTLIAFSALFLGCEGSGRSISENKSVSKSLEQQVNYLDQAMEYVFSPDRFQLELFRASVAANLNEWIKSTIIEVKWTEDPMFLALPPELRSQHDVARIGVKEFQAKDVIYIQEVAWANAISRWVTGRDRMRDFRYLFGKRLKELDPSEIEQLSNSNHKLHDLVSLAHQDLADDEVKQLTQALLLFDWTIRNITLEPTDEVADDEVDSHAIFVNQELTRPARGVPGPGYTLHLEQTLRYGRGDYLQRARVFIELARQLRIDVVMLGFQEDGDSSPRPWLTAAVIGGKAFLFDSRLGLPVPGRDGDSVATLQQVIDQPQILRKLDLTAQESTDDNTRYPVETRNLKNVVALIDCSPIAASLRMKILESGLTGERRLLLSFTPSDQAERVKSVKGLKEVTLWRLPIETLQYRDVFEYAVSTGFEPVMRKYVQSEGAYDHYLSLLVARHRQLSGMFEADGQEFEDIGAKQLLFTIRPTDEKIKSLDTDRAYQLELGIDRDESLTVDQKNMLILAYKDILRDLRAQATYWLGLCHFETQNPSNASNWLGRVEQEDEKELFIGPTRYNLARCHEALMDYDEAIKWYEQDESIQKNGNLLRARFLKQLQDAPKTPTADD